MDKSNLLEKSNFNERERDHSQDWVLSKEKTFFTSKLLSSNGFNHGFFTKNNHINRPEELIKKLNNAESKPIFKCDQIHSNNIIEIKGSQSCSYSDADGIFSLDNASKSLWIYTADCTPIIVVDPIKRNMGIIHVGWRGLTNKIINKILEKLNPPNSERASLIAAVGPSISQNRYEVSTDLIIKIFNSLFFDRNYLNNIKNEEKIIKLKELNILKDYKMKGKYLLDIKKTIYFQLLKGGLTSKNISINQNCTFNDENLFYSWRRDKKKKFQWSCIYNY